MAERIMGEGKTNKEKRHPEPDSGSPSGKEWLNGQLSVFQVSSKPKIQQFRNLLILISIKLDMFQNKAKISIANITINIVFSFG